jgi:hypothetical protein
MNDEQGGRFTLLPGQWYAAEFIGDEFCAAAEFRSHSAIRVDAVAPARSGHRHFDLSFYHANYPEGVRDKVYSLQTLERGAQFILARSADHTPARFLLIYDISWPWLRSHFGVQQPSDSDDITRWLSNHA